MVLEVSRAASSRPWSRYSSAHCRQRSTRSRWESSAPVAIASVYFVSASIRRLRARSHSPALAWSRVSAPVDLGEEHRLVTRSFPRGFKRSSSQLTRRLQGAEVESFVPLVPDDQRPSE